MDKKWINKMSHTHTTEYYAAKKESEALIYTTTWMNF